MNPTPSASCWISEAMTADSVAYCSLVVVVSWGA